MEIQISASYYGYELIFKAENVNVTEDIEERIYEKKEDGKVDFSKPPFRDVSTNAVSQIASLLGDIIYHRKRDFDSTDLIESLFDRLPEKECALLLDNLIKKYK